MTWTKKMPGWPDAVVTSPAPAGRGPVPAAVAFVQHRRVEDWMRLGWMPGGADGGLIGTNHGNWSIIMIWPCACPVRHPKKEDKMREFETGATRDSEDGKLDFEGFLSPFVLERFAEYMDKHRNTPQGRRASDNWQKGIPADAYIKSMWRHFHEAWKLHRAGVIDQRQMEDALCGVLFNAQGYLHELLRR